MMYFSVIFLLPVGSEVFVSVFVREVVFIREDSIEGGNLLWLVIYACVWVSNYLGRHVCMKSSVRGALNSPRFLYPMARDHLPTCKGIEDGN